ncbi:MAG: asparagine synthetase B [Bacteroidetes bacterium]|nr:asparagine synthetase B [Bacteroidota bacterium]
MKKTYLIALLTFSLSHFLTLASSILIPMDETQKNHLKAYGITYWILKQGGTAQWLLNYKGGSFMFIYTPDFEKECTIRGVSYEVIADAKANAILSEIADPEANMDAVKLEKCPKVAVYSPKTKQPWDDAVTLVLKYAEIPYDVVFDEEVMNEKLVTYDWLHLHHEDFTGQYGRFWASYKNAQWYLNEQKEAEATAQKLGFAKVSQMKLAVAKKIRDFVTGGGFLFAMCSATDSYDIALDAEGVDICESMFDGDPADPDMNKKIDYSKGFAFRNYTLNSNPYEYEFANIDTYHTRIPKYGVTEANDLFTLFEFSAKWDPVPTMLCQNHEKVIKGFWGQTVAFDKTYVKPDVLVMGEAKQFNEVRYCHGDFGKGFWTFYGGHDPEDYQHQVEDPPTDLALHPNSPGYRLILNNVLFPAAKKKKQKT